MLHPHHKLAYFNNAQWEKEWIDTASERVQAEYDCKYARLLAGDLESLPQDSQVVNLAKLVDIL